MNPVAKKLMSLNMDLIAKVGTALVDARPILLASKWLYEHHTLIADKKFWSGNKVRNMMVKLMGSYPYTAREYILKDNVNILRHIPVESITDDDILTVFKRCNVKMVRYVLSWWKPNPELQSYVHEISRVGCIRAYKHLYKHSPFELSMVDYIIICAKGHLNLLKYVMQLFGPPPYQYIWQAAHTACYCGRLEIIQYLFEVTKIFEDPNSDLMYYACTGYYAAKMCTYLISINITLSENNISNIISVANQATLNYIVNTYPEIINTNAEQYLYQAITGKNIPAMRMLIPRCELNVAHVKTAIYVLNYFGNDAILMTLIDMCKPVIDMMHALFDDEQIKLHTLNASTIAHIRYILQA